jgi:hypothetical protein
MFGFNSKPGSRRFIYIAILTIAALMVSPLVLAGKPTPSPCSGKYKKDCSTGVPSKSKLSLSGTHLWVSGSSDPYTANCDEQYASAESGEYTCGTDGKFNALTDGGMAAFWAKGQQSDICWFAQENLATFTIKDYRYGWTDDCRSADGCTVEVSYVLQPDEASGFDTLNLVLSGVLDSYDGTDPDPFSSSLGIGTLLTLAEGEFYLSGKHKSIASCKWALGSESAGYEYSPLMYSKHISP